MGRQRGHSSKRQKVVTVLDIGSSKVTCLIARLQPPADGAAAAAAPLVIGFGHQRSQGIKGGTVIHMDAAEQAIRAAVDQAERSAGLTIEEVMLSVACGRLGSETFSASVAIAGESVRSQDIDRVLAAGREYAAREDRVVLHALPTGFSIDCHTNIAEPRGMIAERLGVDVHAVAVDELPLKNLILCVERCHLTVAGLVAAPYASALGSLVGDEARLGATCIDMGAGTTTFSVFCDGHFVHCDAIAIGGNHVTLDIARQFSISLEQAERIKTLHGAPFATALDERECVSLGVSRGDRDTGTARITRAQIAQVVQPRIDEILQLTSERMAAAGHSEAAGHKIILAGGASQMTGLPDYASRILGRPVRASRPRHLRGLPPKGVGPSFAAACGLVLHACTPAAESGAGARQRALATGTGYLARVSQWIRESF
ncbi:MAG: cell division protein FtsA [Hyphomicrobiales bacterium]